MMFRHRRTPRASPYLGHRGADADHSVSLQLEKSSLDDCRLPAAGYALVTS